MTQDYNFLNSILDSLTEQIVVIDSRGQIQFVNRSWNKFCLENAGTLPERWEDINYLEVCERSAEDGDKDGMKAAKGIKGIISQEMTSFYLEYPCHSPDEARWFMMRMTPFQLENNAFFVISHQNITERKLTEEKVLALSRLDGLTNIPNRRCLDEFLRDECSRCARLELPISFGLIDLDHFKLLNDTYGHHEGDECLKNVARILENFARRPSDICARFGGEEFVIVLGNTSGQVALDMLDKFLAAIRALKIPNRNSPVMPILTASIGLVTMVPEAGTGVEEIIKSADKLLYTAKNKGRNRIAHN